MENKKLNLGVARGIITPEVGGFLYGYSSMPKSTGVHDDLTLTVYAFTCGEKKLLYVNATLCVLLTTIADELREALAKQFDCKRDNVVIGATHTHSGPSVAGGLPPWDSFDTEYYEKIFKPVLFSATEEAIKDISPVTLATAIGESDIGINRRMRKDGTNTMWLGECPWGILNKKMIILSFKGEDGAIKGNLVYYGAHGTSAGASTLITRDWSGYMTDALEEKTGGLTSLVLGPEGDIGPRRMLGLESCIEETEALGAYSAKEVLRVFENLGEYKDASIDVLASKMRVSLLPRISKDAALNRMAELKKGVMYNMQELEYNNCENVVKSYEEGYVDKEYEEFEQIVFRIGNIAFATFTFEVFCEIGLRVGYMVKDLEAVLSVCTNGKRGYFPTQSAIAEGGYEVTVFKNQGLQSYADDADYSAIVSTVENINKLER